MPQVYRSQIVNGIKTRKNVFEVTDYYGQLEGLVRHEGWVLAVYKKIGATSWNINDLFKRYLSMPRKRDLLRRGAHPVRIAAILEPKKTMNPNWVAGYNRETNQTSREIPRRTVPRIRSRRQIGC